MLRIHNHLPPKPVFPDMKKTDPAGYHGGGIAHEVAALVSLCFGIRLKSEGITRHWTPGADPAGEPICWDVDQVPMLMRPYGVLHGSGQVPDPAVQLLYVLYSTLFFLECGTVVDHHPGQPELGPMDLRLRRLERRLVTDRPRLPFRPLARATASISGL